MLDFKEVAVYFDPDKKLIGVPCGKDPKFGKYGIALLDIFFLLESGYSDDELEEFILDVFADCYSKMCGDGEPSAIQKYTKARSYNAAVKKYRLVDLFWQKSEGYKFTPTRIDPKYKGSFLHIEEKSIEVPLKFEKGALAQAFRKAMEISIQSDQPTTTIQKQTFTLLCEKEVSYVEPQDDNFINAEDYGVAEIYQGYSYCEDDREGSIAEFFFSIASELDCDISPGNIRRKWEYFHSKATTFEVAETSVAVFTHRAEFRNKKTHKISYFRQMNEYELFACELEIRLAKISKPLHSKLVKLFDEFARSVSLSEKSLL